MDLLRELMEAIFDWISSNKDIWTIREEHLTDEDFDHFMQLVLDMHFLVEIARCQGYLTDNMKNACRVTVSHMESVFTYAGLNPKRGVNNNEWAVNAATNALLKLQEIAETELLSDETPDDIVEEEINEHHYRGSSEHYRGASDDETTIIDSGEWKEDSASINASEVLTNSETEITKT
ncbi:unnamed protein product [Ilex paraguariensis]|uniref:Uncharacterized protein n=1 Tax=Ilex paraguariensis TaxID=185542 RepID=A0ABC8S4M0_9AQUA